MRSRSLTNLIADVRGRTNMENSTFVTDAEITEYLNQELAELWTRLVLNQGQPHYRSSQAYAVTSATPIQALPASFWTVQEVTGTYGGETFTLYPYMAAEHGALMSPTMVAPAGAYYRISGNNIEFRPATSAFTATLYYTPICPRLVAPGDTFDGFNGFEMTAIYGACAIVQEKEKADYSFYENRKAQFYKTVEAAAAHRDMANPERVQEVILRDDIDFGMGNNIFGRWG